MFIILENLSIFDLAPSGVKGLNISGLYPIPYFLFGLLPGWLGYIELGRLVNNPRGLHAKELYHMTLMMKECRSK